MQPFWRIWIEVFFQQDTGEAVIPFDDEQVYKSQTCRVYQLQSG